MTDKNKPKMVTVSVRVNTEKILRYWNLKQEQINKIKDRKNG